MNDDTSMEKVPIADIKIGIRHRQDMGDLRGLADSILVVGLLEPIGITPDKLLVWGERRILAYKILGRTEILARTVDIASIAEGEFHENEMRKNFTLSERLAIAETIKAEIATRGERRGRPPKTPAHAGNTSDEKIVQNFAQIKPGEGDEKIPQNFAEFQPGEETRDFAARRAGFTNREEYRKTKKVVEQAEPEVVKAMDAGDVSVDAAAKLTDLPKEEQVKAVAGGKAKVKETLRRWRRETPSSPKVVTAIFTPKTAPSSNPWDEESPQTDKAYAHIIDLERAGVPIPPKKVLALEIGVSHTAVEKAFAIRRVMGPPPLLDIAMLPKAWQEKYERLVKTLEAKLRYEINKENNETLQKYLDEHIWPKVIKKEKDAALVLNQHKGLMTPIQYKQMLMCFHPDDSASPTVKRESLELLQKLKPVFVKSETVEMAFDKFEFPPFEVIRARAAAKKAAKKAAKEGAVTK